MFKNRLVAGSLLADKLGDYKGAKDTIIVAIPRGGVIVAEVIAKKLKIPLTSLVIKKIESPTNPELALGAVSSLGDVFWDDDTLGYIGGLSYNQKEDLLNKTKDQVEQKEKSLGIEKINPKRKTVLLVDDGIATGSTVIAAAQTLKHQKVKKIILVVPVASKDILARVSSYFDEKYILETPHALQAVGEFYEEFNQVEDEQVKRILNRYKA